MILGLTANVVGSLGFAVFWFLVGEVTKKKLMPWVKGCEWWEQTGVKPQQQQCHSFGFPKEPTRDFPEGVSEVMARDFYCFVLFICGHHLLSSFVMVPVCIYGWDAVSDHGRLFFTIGTLSVCGFDIYDSLATGLRTFCPQFAMRKFGWHPLPTAYFVIICILHHTLSICMVIPMNLKYIHLTPYHISCISLLLAAGACYVTGAYKFSLDVNSASGKKEQRFSSPKIQYSLIVLIQLAVILYTRLYLWFPNAYAMITHFYHNKDYSYLAVGSCAACGISAFNLVLCAESLSAAHKWLGIGKITSGKKIKD